MTITFTHPEPASKHKFNGIIYGAMNTGKTTILESANVCEFTAPTLMVDIDKGLASVFDKSITVFRPKTFREIQELYNFLRFENREFQSVCFDGGTESQRKLSMDEITGMMPEGDDVYTNLASHVPPTQYNWLSSSDQMRRFIRAFRDLSYLSGKESRHRIHVFFTFLQKADEKFNAVCPSLPGVLGMEIGASVDFMGQTKIVREEVDETHVKEKYYLYCKSYVDSDGKEVQARIRLPKGIEFPRRMYDPSIDKIIRLWMSKTQNRSSE